jgi:methionine synthase II (cobalamin-independent)
MLVYRSDVIGSLLHPEYLKDVRRKRVSGELVISGSSFGER